MCVHCLTNDGRELAVELIDQILEKKETVPYERSFLTTVQEGWLEASRKGVKAAVEYLNAVNTMMSHEDVIAILSILRGEAATKLADGLRSDLLNLFDRSYKNGKTISIATTGIEATFNLIDERAVDWLTEHHTYWVGSFFDKQLSGSIATTVTEGMNQGLGRKEIGNLLENFFEDYPGAPVKPSAYWRGLAANAMNRSRNFGLIGGYLEVGIQQLEIVAVMDERTSAFCIEMNGKIISVNRAANQRQQMMNTTNPEDVKRITPWLPVNEIQNLSISQIMDKGVVLPPYHFNCRTTVVAAA